MKKLLLIRHAKAEKDTSVKDIDRPLKYIGIQDAAFMADRLKENGFIPDIIVTSSALRTKTTAEIFAEHFALQDTVKNKKLYEATQQTWLTTINQLPNEHEFIAIVGHNPGMNQILYFLTGDAREVHTCAVAVIEINTNDWAAISEDTGKLVYFSSPME